MTRKTILATMTAIVLTAGTAHANSSSSNPGKPGFVPGNPGAPGFSSPPQATNPKPSATREPEPQRAWRYCITPVNGGPKVCH